jgi:translocator assembly and maintenance protein 41
MHGASPLKLFYKNILCGAFPPVRCAFAYGSAVFHQHRRPEGKMLDLVFVVDDAEVWHRSNLAVNSDHYSFVQYLGSDTIANIQRAGAGVYYNTLVQINEQVLKYGVIGIKDFIDDLIRWKWLYISGRLHKPVLFLTDVEREPTLTEALKSNIVSAACCATLLMEDNVHFTPLEFFNQVAGLSYEGDFRMFVGEDKEKVSNIVRGSLLEFQDLYSSVLPEFVEFLPDNLMMKKKNVTLESFESYIPEAVKQTIMQGMSLRSALSTIVRESSVQQSLKGVVTAGVSKSIVYSHQKLSKMVKSMMYRNR